MKEEEQVSKRPSLNQTLDHSFEQNETTKYENYLPGSILRPLGNSQKKEKKQIKGKSYKQIQSEIQRIKTKTTSKMKNFDIQKFQQYIKDTNNDTCATKNYDQDISNTQSKRNQLNQLNQDYHNEPNQNSTVEQEIIKADYNLSNQNQKLQQNIKSRIFFRPLVNIQVPEIKKRQAIEDLKFFLKKNIKLDKKEIQVMKDDENTNFLKQELKRLKNRNSKSKRYQNIINDRNLQSDFSSEYPVNVITNQKHIQKSQLVSTGNDSQSIFSESYQRNLINKP